MSDEPSTDDTRLSEGPRRVTRRRLLGGAATLGVAGLVTAGGIAVVGGSTAGGPVPAALAANLEQLRGFEQLRAVGDAVDDAGVLDRPVVELTALVAPSGTADPVRWCTRTAPRAVRDHVTSVASEQFAAGRALEVDGWRLAPAEAALALLVARS